jgi:nucleoid DNA-binding protein
MKKREMVQRIAADTEITHVQADAAVEAILAAVKEALRQGEPVILRRFGTWQVRAKRARVGRNPKTGAAAAIPARRVVRFTAGQRFKQAVAGAAHPVGGAGEPGGERRPR